MPQALAIRDEDVERYIREVYFRLLEAENKGADVNDAAFKLNRALELLRVHRTGGEEEDKILKEALALVREVDEDIPRLVEEGERKKVIGFVGAAAAVIVATALSILAYFYSSRVLWGAWIRLRRKWIVQPVKLAGRRGGRGARRRG